jgi:hypothetical protein
MRRLVVFSLCLVLLAGCSKDSRKNYVIVQEDGIKVYKNEDRPSVKDLNISPRQVLAIGGEDENAQVPGREFTWARFLDIDSRGNIYILDSPSASVKKFDGHGNFIKSLGREGSGPGEMKSPYLLNILNDIVYVTEPFVRRIVQFDTEGNFLGNVQLTRGLPNFMQTVGQDKFIAFMLRFEQTDKGIYQNFNLVLMNARLEDIAVLRKYSSKYDPAVNDFPDRFTAYAVGKDTIFVAESSDDRYRINAFDFSGKLKYCIEKDYEKVLFNTGELTELNRSLESLFKKSGVLNYQPVKQIYKKAINRMHYDDQGRLWVETSVKRDQTNQYNFYADIFKHGVFLNRIKLDIFKGYDFIKLQDEKVLFKGNRIFHIDEPEALIRVFEY